MYLDTIFFDTQFQKATVHVPFKDGEDQEVTIQHRPAWSWTVELLRNPQLKCRKTT